MDMKTANSPYMYSDESAPEMDILSAASIGDLSLVNQILQKGLGVDQRNESGWTALMYAANFGHYNVIKLLIDHGSSVNAQEWIQGRSPLMLAASCGHTRCLEVLIALGGADVDMVDFQGRNAAYYAIHSGHGRNKIIAKLLRIQPKPRSISRSRPMATTFRSINPDIVISSENEIVSSTSYQSSTRWATGLSPSPYPKPSRNTEPTSFYSPLQSIGNRGNGTYANDVPLTPSPTSQLYKSLTTPNGGINSASSFSSSSYHQNHCCTFTPNNIGSDMRKRRLAMQSGGDRYSNIPSKASRGYDLVGPMNQSSTGNHDYGCDQSYHHHHHQLGQSQLTIINAIAANVVGAGNKATGVSPKKEENILSDNGQDNCGDSDKISNGEHSSDGDIGDSQSDHKSDQSLQPPSSSTSNGCTQSPVSSNTSHSSDTGIGGSNESSQIISSPSNGNNSSSGSGDGKTSSPITLDRESKSRSPLPENLDDLLERIGLSQYSSVFATHGIDLYVFLTLEDSDLISLGITTHGHKRKIHLAQLRFRESVEITSSQERFLADWLLSERESLKKENHELRKQIQTLKTMAE
ncbi:uncharacterized protein LOC141856981 [Brevipalpus obovatus]|uniref:uncharacterized protein LOC141856981 n=1 Tax=Brevipalpus obovatus TaxID=246614 RepID=UPI003D9DCFEF